jgi:hypothetical protein
MTHRPPRPEPSVPFRVGMETDASVTFLIMTMVAVIIVAALLFA